MTTSPATSLIDRVGHHLGAQKLAFSRHPTEPLLMLRFATDEGEWATFIDVRDQPPRLAIYSVYPDNAAPAARGELATLITRINHGMYIGNFELDLDDGAVRCKTSLELADVELTRALFDRLLAVNLNEIRRCARVIGKVAAGTLPAAAAIRELGLAPEA